jgi:hypothetical protein
VLSLARHASRGAPSALQRACQGSLGRASCRPSPGRTRALGGTRAAGRAPRAPPASTDCPRGTRGRAACSTRGIPARRRASPPAPPPSPRSPTARPPRRQCPRQCPARAAGRSPRVTPVRETEERRDRRGGAAKQARRPGRPGPHLSDLLPCLPSQTQRLSAADS